MSELEEHYDELEEKTHARLELMKIIGAPNVYFDLSEDEPDFDS